MIKMQAYCKFVIFNAFMSRSSTRLLRCASHQLARHELTLTVKENRSKYKDLDFKEQQKALGTDVCPSHCCTCQPSLYAAALFRPS
jgi:hypothetical protein